MNQTKQATLYSYRSSKLITLTDVISNCQNVLEGAIALLYSPQSCQFLKLTDGEFHSSNGEVKDLSKDLSNVFEARIFTEQCELRWLNRNDGQGDAVLLSESEQLVDCFTLQNQKECETLKQRYLLWGKPVTKQPEKTDWKRLAEARIGKLDIPFAKELSKNHQRVYLKTCEYLAKVDDYGNFGVIEERLVRLEV